MNILHVIATMDSANGGTSQAVRNSVSALEAYDHTNEVVSLDDPSKPFVGQDAFPLHALGPGKTPWWYSPQLIPWLLVNLSRFDVVIVHGLWLYHSYAVRKAQLQLRRQQIVGQEPALYIMPHGMLDPWFQRATSRKLKAIRNWVYWKLIEASVVNEADGLLFTCEAELVLAREPFSPYHPKQELNVGFGIKKTPVFMPAMRTAFLTKCPAIQNHPYLLFLSRIHEKKGVHLLVEAYSAVLQTYDISKKKLPKLIIAGPGLETPYGQKIKNLVSENDLLRTSIFFTGMLIDDAKWGAFYGCEAFVLPSHQENFGIAVVEALACGKPVLISDQVNIWREIRAGGGGIVAPDSLAGTQQMIESWLNLSPNEKQLMGQQAQKSFEESFAIAPATLRLLKAIKVPIKSTRP